MFACSAFSMFTACQGGKLLLRELLQVCEVDKDGLIVPAHTPKFSLPSLAHTVLLPTFLPQPHCSAPSPLRNRPAHLLPPCLLL